MVFRCGSALPSSRATEYQLVLSEEFTARTTFGKQIADGLYTASLISAVLGTRLPGPGTMYISQTLNFRAPVKIGDTVAVTVAVAGADPGSDRPSRLSCVCAVERRGGLWTARRSAPCRAARR